MSDSVERLTDELRAATTKPKVDWDAVDQRLFARVRDEVRFERTRSRSSARVWLPMTAVLAAAAAIALVVGRGPDKKPAVTPAPVAERAAAPQEESASPAATVVALAKGAEIVVDGRPVAKGADVPDGSRVEARGGRALLQRKGSAMVVLEPESAGRVSKSDGALVVALERGAVEANVEKRDGDAFVVDVGGARVRSRGTHVRVAADAARVRVDLTEGAIAMSGGDVVVAPAHAEFAPGAVKDTLRVDHDPAAVRPAISFAIEIPEEEPSASAVSARAPEPAPAPASPPPAPTTAVAPAVSVDSHPESTIANAVRACLAGRPAADGVKLTVSTTVTVHVESGAVTLARFDPPIAPEAQSCAAATIYKTRFAGSGDRTIPVEFRYEK